MAGLTARLAGPARGGAGQRVGEYRVHHVVEGLRGVDGDRAECAQAGLISGPEAAQVLAGVPDMAPVVVIPALIQPASASQPN